MSGPKRGHTSLSAARAEELRQQQERERRVRDAAAAHQRDVRSVEAARTEDARVQAAIGAARDAVEAARGNGAGQFASRELDAVSTHLERVVREAATRRKGIEELEAALAASSAAWAANPERYAPINAGKVDFATLVREAQGAAREAKRAGSEAEARKQAERMRQQMEAQRAEAVAMLGRGAAAYQLLDALPHGALAPGEAAAVQKLLDEAQQELAKDRYPAASKSASAAITRADACRERVDQALQRWEQAYDGVRAALETGRSALDAIDRNFVRRWASAELEDAERALRAVEKDVEVAATPTADLAPYGALEGRVQELLPLITSATEQAAARYAEEAHRKEIVEAIVGTLQRMDFNAGARLADDTNPLGDVLITAGHPGGQHITMQVDLDRTVRMNLNDGIAGVDCVADVHNIIDALQGVGVTLDMTDWGTADPDRFKKGGAYFREGTGAHQRTTDA
jgi:hypothetical protein